MPLDPYFTSAVKVKEQPRRIIGGGGLTVTLAATGRRRETEKVTANPITGVKRPLHF